MKRWHISLKPMDNQQNKANFKVLGNWLAKKLVSAAISNFTSWILQGLKRGQYTITLKENRLLLHYLVDIVRRHSGLECCQ